MCASSPLAFQKSMCMSFQQENFISQPFSHQSSCHVGQRQTEPPRKSSLVQIFNKEQLSHWVSAAGSITLKSSTQLTSAIKLRKNIPFLFLMFFVFFVLFLNSRNNTVIKAIKIQSAKLQTVWKEVYKKVKACKAYYVKPLFFPENFCWFSVISTHYTAPSAA